MVKVAVAGGTGTLGLHIVEGIVETGKHEVVVLSRHDNHPVLDKLGVRVVHVSYDDPATLIAALEGVHTVISAIFGLGEEGLTKPQLALLDAAVKAGVKRFAPSEFSAPTVPDNILELYRPKWPVKDAVIRSGLEYTIFENGCFMNYLAVGTKGIGHLYPVTYMFDIENCKATLPGDGSLYHVYTRAEDIGKFVAASLDLERWPELSRMSGDRKRLNEILKLAEDIRGRKFDVTYLSQDEIIKRANKYHDDPDSPYGALDMERTFAQLWITAMTNGVFGYEEANLNVLCPQVQPMGIEEFLKQWWGKA